jgi:hypothetical protein
MRPRLTYANVMATIAAITAFLALGGASYAAFKLPRNSVGTSQIKNNAVTGSKVANGSLAGQDFAANQLPQGPQGSQGPPGPKGDTGPQGPGGSETWHEIGPAVGGNCSIDGIFCNNPEIDSCPWHNLGGGFAAPAAYYRDPTGVVHLRGAVKRDGASCNLVATIFLLPVGYRPAQGAVFELASNDEPATVYVNEPVKQLIPPGSVRLQSGGNPGVWLSLDNISFRCGPSGVDGCP